MTTSTVLVLPGPLRERLAELVRAGYPREACGLLIGNAADGATRVAEVVAARNLNVERARDRYELDPADLLAADDAARAAGREVVGVWHSHPDHPAQPSETDRAAAWEGWSYVIAAVTAAGVRELRSWRLRGGAFLEEELRT